MRLFGDKAIRLYGFTAIRRDFIGTINLKRDEGASNAGDYFWLDDQLVIDVNEHTRGFPASSLRRPGRFHHQARRVSLITTRPADEPFCRKAV